MLSCSFASSSLARAFSSSTSQFTQRYLFFKKRASGLASQTLKLAGRETNVQSQLHDMLLLQQTVISLTVIFEADGSDTTRCPIHLSVHDARLDVENAEFRVRSG